MLFSVKELSIGILAILLFFGLFSGSPKQVLAFTLVPPQNMGWFFGQRNKSPWTHQFDHCHFSLLCLLKKILRECGYVDLPNWHVNFLFCMFLSLPASVLSSPARALVGHSADCLSHCPRHGIQSYRFIRLVRHQRLINTIENYSWF